MRRLHIRTVLLPLAVMATGACMYSAVAQGPKAGTKAKDFSAVDLDGKTHTLKSLSAGGPFVLYFIKEDCPINGEMVEHYNAIGTAYKGKARLIGVINADKKVAQQWAKEHKATYPILLDPGMKIIRAYEAEMSPWATLVDKDGKIGKVWPGASESYLKEINGFVAGAAKAKPATLAFKGAPKQPSGG